MHVHLAECMESILLDAAIFVRIIIIVHPKHALVCTKNLHNYTRIENHVLVPIPSMDAVGESLIISTSGNDSVHSFR